MADYVQPDLAQKRVRFFDGQFLQDQDFIDEQKYHLDRQRRTFRLLGATGIVEGLAVSPTGKAYEVVIGRGTAIDSLGRQLVLQSDTIILLPATFKAQAGVQVQIVYREAPTDVAQTGGKSARRWTEGPIVAVTGAQGAVAVAPNDAPTSWTDPAVLLARISLNDSGVISADGSARVLAGLTTPGAVKAGSLSVSGASTANGSLSVGGPVTVAGTLSAGGPVAAAGTLSTGGHLSVGLPGVVNSEGWDKVIDVLGNRHARLSIRTAGGGIDARVMAHDAGAYGSPAGMLAGTVSAHPLTLQTSSLPRITIDKSGNTGIGTIAPTAKLDIAGVGLTSVDLIVNGRMRSNNDEGGLWVASDRFVGGLETDKIGFFTKAGWSLMVTKEGHVGIGNSSPNNDEKWNRILEVYGASSARLSVRGGAVDGRVGSHDSKLYSVTGALSVGTLSTHMLNLFTSGASRMVITYTGDVGIGTTVPNSDQMARTVDILGAGSANLSIRTGTIDGRVITHDGGALKAPAGMVVGTKSKHPLTLAAGGEARVWVGADGRVSLGAAADANSARLNVAGAGDASIDLTVSGRIKSFSDSGGLWVNDKAFVGGVGGTAAKTGIWTNGAWRLTVNSEGTIGIGTGSADLSRDTWGQVVEIQNRYHARLSMKTTNDSGGVDLHGALMIHNGGAYDAQPGLMLGTLTQHDVSFIVNKKNRMHLPAGGGIYFNDGIFFPVATEWGSEDPARYSGFDPKYQRRYYFMFRPGWNENNPTNNAPAFRYGGFVVSDGRLKEDVHELTGALGMLKRLRGVSFNWNADGKDVLTSDVQQSYSAGPTATDEENAELWAELRAQRSESLSRREVGVVAQEVEAVLPELVTTSPAGVKAVDYTKLSAVLIQAVKEQQQTIQALEARIGTLEGAAQ